MTDETGASALPAPHATIKRILIFGDVAKEDLEAAGHAVRERFWSLRECIVEALPIRDSRPTAAEDFLWLFKETKSTPGGADTLFLRMEHTFPVVTDGTQLCGYAASCNVFHVTAPGHPEVLSRGQMYPAHSAWVKMPLPETASDAEQDELIYAFLGGQDFCPQATNGRFSRAYFLAQAAELAVSFVPGL